MGYKNIPERLKKLQSSDLLTVKNGEDNFISITKQETKLIIGEIIKDNFNFFADEKIVGYKSLFEEKINNKLNEIEKNIDAYIEYRFDMLAEKLSEKLLTRHFENEVNKKVDFIINNKKVKGKF